ncbi:MAG: zinc-binding dehydrogenase [Actinomycetota bacterium]
MTLCLELYRSVPKYLGARALGSSMPGLLSGALSPLRHVDRRELPLPGAGWARVRPRLAGICGSAPNTLAGKSSFYFSALVSMPFVPGHEVVGDLMENLGHLRAGQRVVIDPVLSCAPRGLDPACGRCQAGQPWLCERVMGGHLRPGLQTGYCASTGGGWSGTMLAHASQLHAVPEDLPDEAAVMIEPTACAIHAVRRAQIAENSTVLVVGTGTVGLLTIAAVRSMVPSARVIAVAKHGRQAGIATGWGASAVSSSEALGAVRRATGAFRLRPERDTPFLLGGVDVTFECVGSKDALNLAMRATKGRGRIVLSGMPEGADLSPAWFRELELVGSYTGSGAFEAAMELVAEFGLAKLVSEAYPLSRYREAVDHAMSAGRMGSVKVVFDPRLDA